MRKKIIALLLFSLFTLAVLSGSFLKTNRIRPGKLIFNVGQHAGWVIDRVVVRHFIAD